MNKQQITIIQKMQLPAVLKSETAIAYAEKSSDVKGGELLTEEPGFDI